jgi:hypothetical protein
MTHAIYPVNPPANFYPQIGAREPSSKSQL